jgi:hypothetical protein
MTGILFLLDIVAFVVVVRWAYLRSEPGAENSETGLLGLRTGDSREPRTKAPNWKASAPQCDDPQPGPRKERPLSHSEPRWKASRPRPKPPA